MLYFICHLQQSQERKYKKNIFKGKKKYDPLKEKLTKWAFPSLVSGAPDGVVKNVPAGQSSALITRLPTADSSNLKH